MALDLAGIENVEFYSSHYLEAVLEGDLKAVFKKWAAERKEDGKRLPWENLAGLAERYFKSRAAADNEPDELDRWRLARDFHAYLVQALGYDYKSCAEPLDNGDVCPVLLSLRRDGNPFLWIVDAPFSEGSTGDEDPLESSILREQFPEDIRGEAEFPAATWRDLLDSRIFRIEPPPRWILFLAGSEALLIERGKWPQGKYLRFQLGEILGRKQTQALKATAGLLHRDVLAPEAGVCLHDTLDENSHKHAYAVSTDLKYGVRRAVELLGNEAVYYRREVQHRGVFNEEEFAPKLTSECLTWLYRLLFLFYVEARSSELGTVPMASDAYRKGYSLENLRDLELVPLTTEHARNGTYIHDSLQTLFMIVNQGFPQLEETGELPFDYPYHHSMQVDALNSPLFDDERFDVLKNVRFRNFVLQEVLQLLSLSGEKKRKARGRISYAQLGINQLGAVYEGILSYTGFFAKEDLYEVASEKDNKKLSGRPAVERENLKTYFVPASRIDDYTDTEIVRDEDGRKVKHEKGSFIFRLAGRNREKSASYYTPEVLTKCLVKYALKELLYDEEGNLKKTADEILALTICEPAMGSSAFLIEAVDQLADTYLEARKQELGNILPPEDYQREKRRVKARLATNNCYGVDLNPTAVELAKVSLWLATLYEGGKCPWFGLRLATGNSLVGARREVFKSVDVTRKGTKANPNWLKLVPEPVTLYHGPDGPPIDRHWVPPQRPKGTIYHFLLPAEGMVAFDKDKVIKELVPEHVTHIKEWRKEFCKPFTGKDAKRLEKLSDAVDRLFAQVVRERVLAVQETSDCVPVWGEPMEPEQVDLLVRDQEEVTAALEHESSAYRRLKLAMDAWCAFWFWPIENAYLLPDRATWLAQLEVILKGKISKEASVGQLDLFAEHVSLSKRARGTSYSTSEDLLPIDKASADRLKRLTTLSEAFREHRAEYFKECGLTSIKTVLEGDAGLCSAQGVADRLYFHHWSLRFAEIFAKKGGFDLILGNPPWLKLQWKESGVLSDYNAMIETRKLSATKTSELRSTVLSDLAALNAYVQAFTELEGTQEFLNAKQNYPLLKRVQSNLYKCFISRAWDNGSQSGVASFLHPEGVYDDPKGGMLRAALYPRLRYHFQHVNQLIFFPIGDRNKFSINVYGPSRVGNRVSFRSISNLYHPSTIDASVQHDGLGVTPGNKTEDNTWDFRGHQNRIIPVGASELSLFAALYDEPGTPAQEARLPVIHSVEIIRVLRCIAEQPRKLGDLHDRYFATVMFDETYAQRDSTIRRETCYPVDTSEWILQGPHFYVGTPLYQTPNEGCRSKADYSSIDLSTIREDYLPRTNYVPSCDADEYARRTPKWRGIPVTESYRIVTRKMVSPTGERTLVPSIMPTKSAHIDSCFSLAMEESEVVRQSGLFQSLVFDFWVKTTGKNNFRNELAELLPWLADPRLDNQICLRILALNCVTKHYSQLWEACFRPEFAQDSFCSVDPRLGPLARSERSWAFSTTLRTDLRRRQALVEIDVLASMALSLTLDQLITIYRAQFAVLQQHERERLYDQKGQTVPTSKTAAGNPAVSLVELAKNLKEHVGFEIQEQYQTGGYKTEELRKHKIELSKKEAGVLGVSEHCTMADLLAETEVHWYDEMHPKGRPVRLVGLRYTDPGLEPRMERVYPTPWTRCDREGDYRQAWAEFERRLGKKMPEGTPL